MTTRPFYRPSFIAEIEEQNARGSAAQADVWGDREILSAALHEEIPGLREFTYALEDRGDVDVAIDSPTLRQLQDHAYFKQTTPFITAESFASRAPLWGVSWIVPDLVGVTPAPQPTAEEAWYQVNLHFWFEEQDGVRRIHSEFFSLNEAIGNQANEYDDREKLHIVWEKSPKSDERRIAYLGYGTNEPYDLRIGSKSASGWPRFFTFDRGRKLRQRQRIDWHERGPFDWDAGSAHRDRPDRAIVIASIGIMITVGAKRRPSWAARGSSGRSGLRFSS